MTDGFAALVRLIPPLEVAMRKGSLVAVLGLIPALAFSAHAQKPLAVEGGVFGQFTKMDDELSLDDGGHLRWHEHSDGAETVHRREPGTKAWHRLAVRALSLLPIEGLL